MGSRGMAKNEDYMKKQFKTYAFIDSQNVNLAIKDQNWTLDFSKFKVYLKDKYHAEKVYLFIGFIPANQPLYAYLQDNGYILIFKPTFFLPDKKVKGNVDAELVLHTMIEYSNYDKAIIVTDDGDFYCLVEYLLKKNKLEAILIPNRLKFSALLKRKMLRPHLRYMNDLKDKLGYEKKRPRKDETSQGDFSVRDNKMLAQKAKKVKNN